VIERLRHAYAALRGAQLPVPEQKTGGFIVRLDTNNLDVTPIKTKSDELDSYVGWVYGCVSTIAGDLRTNPRGLFIKQGKRREDWKPMPEEKIPPVFKRPNLRQTWGQLIEFRNIYKDLTGEAYWHLITNAPGGKIQGIEMVQSDWIDEPVFSNDRKEIIAWRVTIPGKGVQQDIDARDLIPDFYPNPKDQTRGASPVMAFALAHHLDIYMRAYGLKMIKDGALVGQYVSSESIENTDQADAAEARIMKRFRTPGRIPVFGKGTTLQNAGLPLKDLDMLRMIKPSMDQILAIYKVPRSKFGLTEGVGITNQDTADKAYQENCLLPRLMTFDEIVNEIIMPRIFGRETTGIVYESESPVEADREWLLKKASAKFDSGASTVNMFRQEMGDDGVGPDGDVYMVPNSVVVTATLSELIGLGPAPAPGAPATPATNPDGTPVENPPAKKPGDTTQDPANGPAEANPPDQQPADGEQPAKKTRVFQLDAIADRISKRIQEAQHEGRAQGVEEIAKLRKANAELRYATSQENLERTAKGKLRAVFTKESKNVRAALALNVRKVTRRTFRDELGETTPEGTKQSFAENVVTRDWLDEAMDRTQDDWRNLLRETIGAGVRTGWGLLQEEVAGALSFNVFEQRAAEYAARQAGVRVHDIARTTEGALRDVIRQGLENGQSIDAIAKAVGELYDGWKGSRANTIARTETSSAIGYGKFHAARETNRRLGADIRRSWSAVIDNRTRDHHHLADADINERNRDIRVDEHYIVGGIEMAHPGDPTAPASEVINCRCTETYRDVTS